MQLGVPTSVEKYELLEEIGRGGMATVYRARDLRLQRMVALKVMHPHLQGAKEARARFAREALTVARLRHPGLLEIFDYSGEDSDISFIATELLTGPTLKRFVELHPQIPAEIVACMGLQVASALLIAHQAGVIHRDVKPENVMVHEGRLKLTDFGIAQLLDAQGMTTTGQVLGSPGHMAPEQIEGKECTASSDIFALGTVLYLLATGELPFAGRNPHQVLKQIVEGNFRDPLQVCPAMGARMAAILQHCLVVDPAARYASAEALSTDLRAFVAEMGISDPDATLRAYLEAPEVFAETLTAELIERQTELGEQAARDGKSPVAREYWNRVLSLDDGNARVLAAVQRLSRRERARRLFRRLSVAVGLVVVAAVLWQVRGGTRELKHPAARLKKAVSTGSASTGADRKTSSSSSQVENASAEATPTSSSSAPERDRVARSPVAARRRRVSANALAEQSLRTVPRLVVFSPVPANVSIAVDGAAPRAFGPSFHDMELLPGEHNFKFVGAHDCCVDEAFTVDIPPGTEPLTLSRRLSFRPAGLYVVTDSPANVLVDGNVKGRSRSVLQVPQTSSLVEIHDLEVTAPGYEPFVTQVQLRAGQVLTVEAELVAR